MQALVSETFGVHPLGSLHRGPPGAAQQVGWSGSQKCPVVTEALPSSLQTGVAVALSGSRSFVVEMGLQRIFFQNQPLSGRPCRSSLVAGAQCPGFLLFLVLHRDWPS